MRVLLVEDEVAAARLIAKGLREQAYAVDVVCDGERASDALARLDYDIVVLDVGLPCKDGLAVCRDLRTAGSAIPVLMLTARDHVEARIDGLDAGADDYLTKPFDFGELLARLRALGRRRTASVAADRLQLGDLVVDTRTHEVAVRGVRVVLTAREYALLEYFCRRSGEVVDRLAIAEHVWDHHYEPDSNVIEVFVQRLRRKLDDGTSPSIIRTRRGEGYQLVPRHRAP